MAHPLSSEEEWYFAQHQVQISGPVHRIVQKDKKGRRRGDRKITLNATNSCREGIISGLRSQVSKGFGELVSASPHGWQRRWVAHSDVDLERTAHRQPGQSFVAVHAQHITSQRVTKNPQYKTLEQRKAARATGRYYNYWEREQWKKEFSRRFGPAKLTNKMIQDYLDVCDAVVGPITILLNPDRYQGNWWKSTVAESKQGNNMLRWYGVDNTCVAHPVLASLYSGLVRQCAYIARTSLADRVRSDVADLNLRKCLTDSDEEQALVIVKKMQKWIAVPAPKGGGTSNIPVGIGTMPKILALHKAVYAHGFEKTFGASFTDGWGAGRVHGHGYGYDVVGGGGASYNGIHTFMGAKGTNAQGNRIKALAKTAE